MNWRKFSMAKLTKCKDCNAEISKSAKSCPNCGAPVKKSVSIIGAIVIVVIVFIVFFSLSDANKSEDDTLKNMSLQYSVNKTGFNSVLEGNFIVINNNDYPVKDFEILCTHYAPSGTKIDSNQRDVYELVNAKSKKAVNKFNMGFINSQIDISKTTCRIVSVKKA